MSSSSAPDSRASPPATISRRRAPGPAMPSSRRATPSAAPGTCSGIRASAPTRTCTRWATRSGPGPARRPSPTDPTSSGYIEDTAADEGIDGTSGSATGSSPHDWSQRRRAAGTSPPSGPTPTRRSNSPAASSSRAPATTATTTATPPTSTAWTASGASSSTPRPGPRTSTGHGKRIVVDRQRRHRRHAHPVAGRDRRARHDAAAVALLHRGRAPEERRSPSCSSGCCRCAGRPR